MPKGYVCLMTPSDRGEYEDTKCGKPILHARVTNNILLATCPVCLLRVQEETERRERLREETAQ